MKIYFAGPLFTTAERDFNKMVADHLRLYGHEVFLPQEIEQAETTADAIFNAEVKAMKWCDAIVANMDGSDPDSGTCWEVGNCWREKLSVVFRTDIRDEEPFGPFNLMMHRAANTVINCKWKSADQVGEAIDTALRALYDSGAIPKGA